MKSLITTSVVILGVLLAACGDDDSGEGPPAVPAADTAATGEAPSAAPTDTDDGDVDDLVEQQEAVQEQFGGGGATLAIGDQTWTFDSVLCGFGPEEIGDPDAEFVLSAVADGLQLYVDVSGFGHSIELTDIGNLGDPELEWVASALYGSAPEEFVVVSGKQVSATTEFVDLLAFDPGAKTEGSLTAQCP